MAANEALNDLLDSLLDDKVQLEKYITHPKGLLIDDLSRTQRHFPRTPNSRSIFHIDVTPLTTELKVERDLKSGRLLGFYEVEASHVGKTAKTSTSMKRAPGPPTEGVKGSSTSFPFWPGGMDEPTLEDLTDVLDVNKIDFINDLETIPPGFECGMDFDIPIIESVAEKTTLVKLSEDDKTQSMDEINIVKLLMSIGDDDELCFPLANKNEELKQSETSLPAVNESIQDSVLEIEDIAPKISKISNVLNISQQTDPCDIVLSKTEWAEVINVKQPVVDFYKQVPNMAHTWPFELDTFQKQAILHLEKHESVFVAAHTSAGKTVVAEYAIALSMKHLTKTIYTSPIKALSNQKFRDFKKTFKDVGLITGDVQLSVDSSCLIMTTEILRSMLYNGSDTIRDLEWVIFDEVHYINDAERGVVWEEVLILLPKHVNIVLLSATVPNALEFADWVGRTKRQKIYVISTPKRPVPLEHYLYTGTNVKMQNELYLIVGPDSKISVVGYNAAKEAYTGKKDAHTPKRGSTTYQRQFNLAQERNVWLSILNMLKKKDQLPVVAFTFSRKLCDQNAHMLTSVDLTTSSEKNKVHEFVQKCMQRLKGSDRSIPQVKGMRELLMRGIGIHHSGILPILKEVVEMLFQDGLVKLLFATETFAMGVNMPARTVIFDSITKYDGTQKRHLRPEEYIQMAGRAGRRGLDTSGMVIILCKTLFPERSDLEIMIQGKPTILESRFRLTYAMILNLLRVEKLRVEEMMKRSFSEINTQRNVTQYEKRLGVLQQKMSALQKVDCSLCRTSLDEYYNASLEYVQKHKEFQKLLIGHPQGEKALCPGRVVIVVSGDHSASLGIVLRFIKSINSRNLGPAIDILIATDEEVDVSELQTKEKSSATKCDADPLWVHMLNAHKFNLNIPEGNYKYDIVKCSIDRILCITQDLVNIDGEKVFKDWDRRQVPRFKDDPPSQSFIAAAQELMSRVQNLSEIPRELDPVKDLHIKDVDICDAFSRLGNPLRQLDSFSCITCAAFEEHFKIVYNSKKLNEELQSVQYQLSEDSLELLPEYKARVEILKTLRYIDSTETVQLKGRVACEISNHELVTTELVFDNILASFQPEEIAALLSCMVCQEKRQKDASEAPLSQRLAWGKEQILNVVKRIGDLQQKHQIADEKFEEQFRFELVEVVYEWAKGMPFAEIMSLTDVQEGIIVRCIQRLDEILRDVKDAARIVGDPILYKKMEAASQTIKRDIVFAASLYTQ